MPGEIDTDTEKNSESTGCDCVGHTVIEDRYQKIFEHNNDGVMIVDLAEESFFDVNPAACELLGYTREELLSMDAKDIHPEDVERVRKEFITQIYEEGAGFTDDLTCITKDGTEIPTEISGAALDPSKGEDTPTEMIAMLRDVSKRVENREKLEQKVERLDRFAHVVSHDLRNPLAVIDGHVQLAREASDSEHLATIDEMADRMDQMLSNLLELTRQGKVIGDKEPVTLETLALDTWAGLQTEQAILEVESSVTVDADPERLQELLENLFENAISHVGPTVAITVGVLDEDDKVGFYVEDDGEGIREDDREAVLEWGHTSTSDGTGFGLAIVNEIVEAHGWSISITDAETGGARFEISIHQY
ncbi:sensor histidine kinase [Salinigranum halophilum]|uniref:sensor histidine kinase n=1 Tax=Salinigranum halophilum TaxID=2565931 RepID=UPI0010A91B89|nr:PAS domain-containing sensor histidine kinase [Salinigranum halophilum]